MLRLGQKSELNEIRKIPGKCIPGCRSSDRCPSCGVLVGWGGEEANAAMLGFASPMTQEVVQGAYKGIYTI